MGESVYLRANAYLEPLQGARTRLLGGVPALWKGVRYERMPADLRVATPDHEAGADACCEQCASLRHGRRCAKFGVLVDGDQVCDDFTWPRGD